jgi:hypothetical protein
MAHAFAAMHLVAIGLNGHSGHAGECQLSVKADVTADIAKATLLTHRRHGLRKIIAVQNDR